MLAAAPPIDWEAQREWIASRSAGRLPTAQLGIAYKTVFVLVRAYKDALARVLRYALEGNPMAEVDETCPPDDRTRERAVFPGVTTDGARNAMDRACRAAGIAHYHPHDLRHRRLSLWHAQGVPARELAASAGHARASMSLDVYSHVLVDDDDEWS
jgi:integrase